MLEAARQEGSDVGKLRIFVGAAPGVGKTYEMLQHAHAKLKDAVDVALKAVVADGTYAKLVKKYGLPDSSSVF